MSTPILVVVTSIGTLDGTLNARLEGYNPKKNASEGVAGDEILGAPLVALHLKAWDATALLWRDVGHAATGKLMLDGTE